MSSSSSVQELRKMAVDQTTETDGCSLRKVTHVQPRANMHTNTEGE